VTTEEVTITNKLGMHARPAALFVQTASKFTSEVTVSKDGSDVNGKSVMGMMMLAAECGSTLKLTISGSDEKVAMQALKELFNRKFDED
jgi:phosphocarrier protein